MREVRTPPPELAVQVVRRHRGQRAILAHVGWACTDAQLEILLEPAGSRPRIKVFSTATCRSAQSIDGVEP